MNTRISPILLKHNESSTSKKTSLFQSGANLMSELISVIVAVFAAIFVMWINGRQHEFDQLQDKSQ